MAHQLLLDTHAFLWWLFDSPRLSGAARDAVGDPENDVFVSSATAWEIATKARLGLLPEAGDVPERIRFYIGKSGFRELPILMEHAQSAGALPAAHRDPFDRMLAAQARQERLTLVTVDSAFRAFDITVLW